MIAAGYGLDRDVPRALGLRQDLLAEVVALGEHAEHALAAVFSRAQLVHLPVRDQEYLVGRPARFGDHLTGFGFPLDEPVGELTEQCEVFDAAQRRELTQAGRDEPDLRPGLDETHAPAADGVAQ